MDAAELDYDLPVSAIAQLPVEPRDAARLLVDRGPSDPPAHHTVADLPELLAPGDLLVVNDTRVRRARLLLRKPTGGRVEVLLLAPLAEGAGGAGAQPGEIGGDDDGGDMGHDGGDMGHDGGDMGHDGGDMGHDAGDMGHAGGDHDGRDGRVWEALVRPSRKVPPGTELAGDGGLAVRVDEELGGGRRVVTLLAGDPEAVGLVPLPPYIDDEHAAVVDPGRYQTIYARRPGSAAAPTAGLHLTEDVLGRCVQRGIRVRTVELVVGLDTFRPIATETVEAHPIHTEAYSVPPATMEEVRNTREAGGSVVAVGTTVVRALESAAATARLSGRTDLFIRPGHRFLTVDRLLTNFHVPRTTLLALVAAFVGDRWRSLYDTALAEGYRFLSFGDAMLLTRGRGRC